MLLEVAWHEMPHSEHRPMTGFKQLTPVLPRAKPHAHHRTQHCPPRRQPAGHVFCPAPPYSWLLNSSQSYHREATPRQGSTAHAPVPMQGPDRTAPQPRYSTAAPPLSEGLTAAPVSQADLATIHSPTQKLARLLQYGRIFAAELLGQVRAGPSGSAKSEVARPWDEILPNRLSYWS